MQPDEPIEPVVIVPVVTQEAITETDEEIDLVAEMVERGAIEDEERHDELMEGVNECRARLESLNLSTTGSESPSQAAIMAELVEIRSQLSRLLNRSENSSTNQSSPPPSESMTEHDEPVTVESTDGPKPEERAPKKYRRL